MADAMLALFVEYVETGRWSDIQLTISIPGGIFAGELISARQFLEEWEEQTVYNRLEELSGDLGESLNMSESKTSPAASPDYLHMRKAVILSVPPPRRGKPPELRQLRVRLRDVSAWSAGRSED